MSVEARGRKSQTGLDTGAWFRTYKSSFLKVSSTLREVPAPPFLGHFTDSGTFTTTKTKKMTDISKSVEYKLFAELIPKLRTSYQVP